MNILRKKKRKYHKRIKKTIITKQTAQEREFIERMRMEYDKIYAIEKILKEIMNFI